MHAVQSIFKAPAAARELQAAKQKDNHSIFLVSQRQERTTEHFPLLNTQQFEDHGDLQHFSAWPEQWHWSAGNVDVPASRLGVLRGRWRGRLGRGIAVWQVASGSCVPNIAPVRAMISAAA